MHNSTEQFEIIYNEYKGTFYFRLPATTCEKLLITNYKEDGIILCHSNRVKLENFIQVLFKTAQATELFRSKQNVTNGKIILIASGILLINCIYITFNHDIGKRFPHWIWPLNLASSIVCVYCLYNIYINFLFEGKGENKVIDNTQRLRLLDIHQKIQDEFSCANAFR